jgi:hypothetical protein
VDGKKNKILATESKRKEEMTNAPLGGGITNVLFGLISMYMRVQLFSRGKMSTFGADELKAETYTEIEGNHP